MELSDHDSSFSVSVSRFHAVTVYYLYNPTDLDFRHLQRRSDVVQTGWDPVKEEVILFTITSRPTKDQPNFPLRVLLPGN